MDTIHQMVYVFQPVQKILLQRLSIKLPHVLVVLLQAVQLLLLLLQPPSSQIICNTQFKFNLVKQLILQSKLTRSFG